MPVERWSDQVSVARLADDPQFTDDLQSLQDEMEQRSVNAVLDFSSVHFINSSNIARLLRLRKRAVSTDLKLILCSISTQLWGTFLTTGLDKVFDFRENVPMALATLQISSNQQK